MRGFVLFIILLLTVFTSSAQKFSAEEFLFASSLNEKKFENFLNKRFSPCGNKFKNDTIINLYSVKADKKRKERDSVIRTFETYHAKDYFSFAFFTSSQEEFNENKKALYHEGFFCGIDSDSLASVLFQKKEYVSVGDKA